uniref:Uncharacterized protein n=1 Tax=Spongospora subterranea TaxID=70186 RepID=A0A0H5RCL3_9EUKA|eukprot:CRZ12000.1 hypothetical protein [Spongospora subterranea]
MAEQEDRPLYDYGEDVERYLTDKGSNIDELTKRHRHNVAESGANIESDIDDNKAVQRRVSKVDALSSSTTPIAQRSEQLHRGRPTVWSKVTAKFRLYRYTPS